MLKLGLVGAGAVALGHLDAIADEPYVQVVGIADPSLENRSRAGARIGCSRLHADYRSVLDDPEVAAVDICLPHHLHEAATLDAFDAGKDVLIEKPIALTLEQADRMMAAAKAKGRRFYVSLNDRFNPAHRTFKEILDSGVYGTPFLGLMTIIGDEFLRMNVRDNWKGRWDQAGGGAFADTGTHMIYTLLWWFGRPRTVTCNWGRFLVQHDEKADDNCVVTLGYDRMIVNLVVTYTATSDPWTEHKHFYFPGHSVHLEPGPDHPVFHAQGKRPSVRLETPPLPVDWRGTVAASVRHFVRCLAGIDEPEFGPEVARETLEIILLAYRAAREGRTLTV